MKKDILTISVVAIVGLGAWLYLGGSDTGPRESAEIAAPEMLDNDYNEAVSETLLNPPVAAPTVELDAAPAVAEEAPAAPAEGPALSELEQEIIEVLANAHAVHDNYERAEPEIEAKLDIQVRAALERRAITPREAPEYRDYLRQIAIEDKAREEEDYELSGPAVSGIFADRSFVTEE